MDDFRRARVCCLCVYAFSIFLLGRCGVSSAALAARSSTGATLILAVPVRIHGATTLNERAHARRASGPVRICCAWTRLCAHRLCAMALGRTDFAPRGGVRLHTSACARGGLLDSRAVARRGLGQSPSWGLGQEPHEGVTPPKESQCAPVCGNGAFIGGVPVCGATGARSADDFFSAPVAHSQFRG